MIKPAVKPGGTRASQASSKQRVCFMGSWTGPRARMLPGRGVSPCICAFCTNAQMHGLTPSPRLAVDHHADENPPQQKSAGQGEGGLEPVRRLVVCRREGDGHRLVDLG